MAVGKRRQAGIRIEIELGGTCGVADGIEIPSEAGDRNLVDADEAAFVGLRVVRQKGTGDLGAGQAQGLRQRLAAGEQSDFGGFLDIGEAVEVADGTGHPHQVAQLHIGNIPPGRKKVHASSGVLNDDIKGGGGEKSGGYGDHAGDSHNLVDRIGRGWSSCGIIMMQINNIGREKRG